MTTLPPSAPIPRHLGPGETGEEPAETNHQPRENLPGVAHLRLQIDEERIDKANAHGTVRSRKLASIDILRARDTPRQSLPTLEQRSHKV